MLNDVHGNRVEDRQTIPTSGEDNLLFCRVRPGPGSGVLLAHLVLSAPPAFLDDHNLLDDFDFFDHLDGFDYPDDRRNGRITHGRYQAQG